MIQYTRYAIDLVCQTKYENLRDCRSVRYKRNMEHAMRTTAVSFAWPLLFAYCRRKGIKITCGNV